MASESRKTRISNKSKSPKSKRKEKAIASSTEANTDIAEEKTPVNSTLSSEEKSQYVLELEEMLVEYEALRDEVGDEDLERQDKIF